MASECGCVQHPPWLGWPGYVEAGRCPIHSKHPRHLPIPVTDERDEKERN